MWGGQKKFLCGGEEKGGRNYCGNKAKLNNKESSKNNVTEIMEIV